MPVRHWRWRITFTVRYNRISGEECLADKCHDNDRLGLAGRITSFHHPTPDYADRPILRGRGWPVAGVRLFADLPGQMISSHDNHFSLSSSSPLFFSSPFTSLLPRMWPHTYLRYPNSSSSFQTSLVPFPSNNLSFTLSPTILSSNSTWKSLTRRARDTRSPYELVPTNVTRRHLCTCKGSFIEFHRAQLLLSAMRNCQARTRYRG